MQACGRRFRSGRLNRAKDDEDDEKKPGSDDLATRGKNHARKDMSRVTKVELGADDEDTHVLHESQRGLKYI